MNKKISNDNKIFAYLHCKKCLEEKPIDTSPQLYQRIQAGWTKQGLQIWCVRHNCNMMHIDFEGQRHPANCTVKKQ